MMSVWNWQPPLVDAAAHHGCGIFGDGDGSLVLGDLAKTPAAFSGQMRANAAPWVPPGQQGKVATSTNKAFAVKDPKTGEVIPRSALLERPGEQVQSKVKTGGLTPEQKARWQAAARVVTIYMRQGRWTPDHSSFSALNVDQIRIPAPGRSRQHRAPAVEPQEMAAPADKPQEISAPASEPQETVAPVLESQEPSTDTSLGDFFKPAKGAKGKRAKRSQSNMQTGDTSTDAEATERLSTTQEDLVMTSASQDALIAFEPLTSSNSSSTVAEVNESTDDVVTWSAEDARSQMLQLRFLAACEPTPAELVGLTATVEMDFASVRGTPRASDAYDQAGSASRKDRFKNERGTENSWRSRGPTSDAGSMTPASSLTLDLTPSANAYRARGVGNREVSRIEELRRSVQASLNKICPESVASIAEKIGEVQVESQEELRHIISLIFKKAVSEPHYIQTYADLVFRLRACYPEFPDEDGGKPVTFKALLLNICQDEFDSLPTCMSEKEAGNDPEEELTRKKTKERILANMKFIGHLFLRQMLSARVIGSVIKELTLCDDADQVPEEHVIECAVELLMSVGHTLEGMPAGKQAMGQVCGRLLDLKGRKTRAGQAIYCKRIQFAIQDLLDARKAGWARKVFGGVAKTKAEIKLEQERDLNSQAYGGEVVSGQVVISGQRPEYISARSGPL